MRTSIILLTSLLAITINAQSHPMITPAPAPLARRQDNDDDSACLASLGHYISCLGIAMSPDPCMKSAHIHGDIECGCKQASSIYGCYTSFCTPGPASNELAKAVDECGIPYGGGAAPTGSPDDGDVWDDGDDVSDDEDDEDEPTRTGGGTAPATQTPNSAGSLKAGAWGLVAAGAVVGMLV
ncbi:hypothetical protein QBC41DRAFT_306522 [Cercophora samala]|uniref:Extracellular membrane protein CFEM domain-containing protein n=1 Tax=Cercophora samala TaxID=330535 RepID=A0AA39Z5F9_9PEZI|nr:hypothetical protein QBC41DRAFT_306522 [Cercophora samala]